LISRIGPWMIPSMSLESSDQSPRRPEGSSSGRRWRVLDDPVAIRALAHPLRMDLMAIIHRLGRTTTAQAAREAGISHGLASHHLRQLAKYGFVEQVAGKDNRERPWRLVATSYRWGDNLATPEGTAAADILEQVLAERALSEFLDWQQRRGNWPVSWREHAGLKQSTVYLTEAEFSEIAAAIDALLRRYAEERPLDDVAARPASAVAVDFTVITTPAAKQLPAQG
jgi:DNA-binding transcriptional ArsR family regulator